MTRHAVLPLLSASLLVLAACDPEAVRPPASGILLSETAPPQLNHPKIPDTRDVLRWLARNAKESIWIGALYVNHDADAELFRAIRKAAAQGLDVRLVLAEGGTSRDKLYRAAFDMQTNIRVRFLNLGPYGHKPYGALHAKYMIVDGRVAVVGSANYSWPGLNDNREINAVITDPEAVRRYVEIFQTDYTLAGFGEPLTNRPLFSGPAVPFSTNRTVLALEAAPWQLNNPAIPDLADCLTNLMLLARSRIDAEIYLYSAAGTNDAWFERSLFAALDRGVRVRMIFNKPTYEERDDLGFFKYPDYRNAVARARARGAEVRFIDTRRCFTDGRFTTTHSKLLIVDGRFACIASGNWTPTSARENRELGVFTKDSRTLRDCLTLFETDWAFSEE